MESTRVSIARALRIADLEGGANLGTGLVEERIPGELLARTEYLLGFEPSSQRPLPDLVPRLTMTSWRATRWRTPWWHTIVGLLEDARDDSTITGVRAYLYREYVMFNRHRASVWVAVPLVEGTLVAYGSPQLIRVELAGRPLAQLQLPTNLVCEPLGRPVARWAATSWQDESAPRIAGIVPPAREHVRELQRSDRLSVRARTEVGHLLPLVDGMPEVPKRTPDMRPRFPLLESGYFWEPATALALTLVELTHRLEADDITDDLL